MILFCSHSVVLKGSRQQSLPSFVTNLTLMICCLMLRRPEKRFWAGGFDDGLPRAQSSNVRSSRISRSELLPKCSWSGLHSQRDWWLGAVRPPNDLRSKLCCQLQGLTQVAYTSSHVCQNVCTSIYCEHSENFVKKLNTSGIIYDRQKCFTSTFGCAHTLKCSFKKHTLIL